MKKRKLLCLVLSLCLVLGMAGCSKGKNSAAPSGASAESGASAAAPASAGTPFDLSMLLILYNQAPDPDGEFWKDMTSTYNVKMSIDWVPESTYTDKLALTLATNAIPDVTQIANLSEPVVVKAMDAGQFLPLDDLLDFEKYPNFNSISSSAWLTSKYKGSSYVFPRSRGRYNDCTYIRGDLLEKYGLPKPTTLEELTDYFRAIKAEDGMIPVPVELGGSTNALGALFRMAMDTFGPGHILPVYTEDGEGIVYQCFTEAYAQTVEWLQGLYEEGLLASEFPLYNTERNQEVFLAGIGGMRGQNAWHRYRLETELQKAVPGAWLETIFGLDGPGGSTVLYDKGFYGGYALNASLKKQPERLEWILDFYNKTADPDKYWYFKYGLEGSYYTVEDGFPKMTELGQKEVTNSFYGPYVLATDLYDKVNSPLADAAYNRETQERVKDVDVQAAKIDGAPFCIFEIIQSPAFAQYWSMHQKEFEAYVADTVTGTHTMEEFRAYQQQYLDAPEMQQAFKEFKENFDEFDLGDWSPEE